MMIFQTQNLVRFVLACSLLALVVGSVGCSRENPEEMFQQGIDAMTADNLDEAVIWFKKAIQQNSKMAIAHYKLGEVYRKKGNPKMAFAHLSQAVQQDPKLAEARKELALLLVENQALDKTVTVCKQYLEVNGDDEDIYLILGNALAYTKKVDEAVEVLRKGQAIYPENTTLVMNLAKLLVMKGDVEEGRAMMEELAARETDNIPIQVATAHMYEALERYDLAVMTLEASKEKFPENPLPYLALAQLALKKNQPDSAKNIILDAENTGVKDSRLYRLYAMITHRQGNSDEALRYFEKSVEAASDETRIANLMILADYNTYLKNYKEAQKILETIIAEDASKKQLKSKVVELFIAQGEYDQARISVDHLLEEDSGDARGHFLKGMMMMQDKDVAEARKEFSMAKELAPNVAENQFLYGMTFLDESEQISITEISEALKKNPKLYKARMALAELYARKGDLQQSLDELDKILSRQDDTKQLDKVSEKQIEFVKVRVLRIVVLMRMNKPEVALEDAKLLLELQPEDSGHIFRLAEIYYSTKNLDEALPLYEKLQQEKPDSIQLLNRIVGVFMLKKEYERALEEVDAFLAKYPDNGAAILVKAKIYFSQGHLDLAENILLPEAAKGEDLEPVVMLAEVYKKNKDNDNALKYYEKAVELVPENVVIRMKLADFYLQGGQSEKAIESYEKVLEQKEDFLPAMNNLAYLYTEENKNLDRALELANEVARKLPDNPDVTDTLGWIYVMKNMYSQAEPYLQIAISAKPDNPTIIYHMGMLRFGQRNTQDAEKLLKNAIQKGISGNELAQANEALADLQQSKEKFQKAISEKEKGNASQAIALYEEILASEGFSGEAAADLAMLYAEQDKDITKALELAQKAYDAQPANPHAADALGWVYYHQGSLLMAKQYIEQAIEKDKAYGPAYVHLGAVYLKKEEPEVARKKLETAKSMKLSVADQQLVGKLLSEIK
ncbi:MAG: tetratricopeptide repeat protein [Thermodesulfobacteriota bacterium]|nr:tetratricopeptide repeat protein [Thermodesulfobacteriota bacterium]